MLVAFFCVSWHADSSLNSIIALFAPMFWVLQFMQNFWYKSDWRRERFVAICRDVDVQQLTWDAYMNKELVKAKPLAHAKIFWKNIFYLTGLIAA